MECYCKQETMAVCLAHSDAEQRLCRFYTKASYLDRCMWFVFDEYCDCMEAQEEARYGQKF